MDAILQFIQQNPITTVFLLAVAIIASVLTLTKRSAETGPNPEDMLPSYKRFDRREIERGDRRKSRLPWGGGADRREGPRRKRD